MMVEIIGLHTPLIIAADNAFREFTISFSSVLSIGVAGTIRAQVELCWSRVEACNI